MPPTDIEELYDQYSSRLFHYLYSHLKDETEARDALQDLFVKLSRSPDPLRGVEDPTSYLFRVARNQAIDRIRHDQSRRKNETQAGTRVGLFAPELNPDSQLIQQRVAEALSDLPPDQHTVVHLKLWEGQSFRAIAELEGISENTAASRYRYGMEKLRNALHDLYHDLTETSANQDTNS